MGRYAKSNKLHKFRSNRRRETTMQAEAEKDAPVFTLYDLSYTTILGNLGRLLDDKALRETVTDRQAAAEECEILILAARRLGMRLGFRVITVGPDPEPMPPTDFFDVFPTLTSELTARAAKGKV